MSLVHLKAEDFNEEIKEGMVLVDFYADWCGPCKMLGPVLEAYGNDRADVKVIKVNVDEHDSLAAQYGIMSVPALKLFKDGTLVDSKSGFMTKDAIDKWISDNQTL